LKVTAAAVFSAITPAVETASSKAAVRNRHASMIIRPALAIRSAIVVTSSAMTTSF
jgi:hypothetical protein